MMYQLELDKTMLSKKALLKMSEITQEAVKLYDKLFECGQELHSSVFKFPEMPVNMYDYMDLKVSEDIIDAIDDFHTVIYKLNFLVNGGECTLRADELEAIESEGENDV